MTRRVEYRFGRLSCQSSGGLSEGFIEGVEHVQAALKALRQNRRYDAIKWWDVYNYCSKEETADRLIGYLKERHSDSLIFVGERPSHAAHGKIFFDKMAELELTVEEEQEVERGMAEIILRIPYTAKEYL